MKTVPEMSADEAVALVREGDTLLVGGFGMTGNPVHLLDALARAGTGRLTYVGNNVGEPGLGGGKLLRNGQLRHTIGSFFTSNPEAVKAAQDGTLGVELLPQGTLAEALRAGGAGLAGFYTPTAAGTPLADGREVRDFDGTPHVFQRALRGNVALLRAWRADTAGNLVYRMTENNFNQAAAMAADQVIVEVEEIVPVGTLAPETIHTPGCFVDRLVQATLTEADLGSSASVSGSARKVDEGRLRMARAALAELRAGDIVNLGVGIPTLVAELITPEHGIILHSENGMLGVGPSPADGGGALDYPVNAGKVPVTALPGASYFDSATSFAMIRGGHVDAAIMGGLQVDADANLANWAVPGKPLLGVGGAMDLASGAGRLIITMTHTNRDGSPKIVRRCDLPLTATGRVSVIVTELATFRFVEGRLTLTALADGTSVEDVRTCTDAEFVVAVDIDAGGAVREQGT